MYPQSYYICTHNESIVFMGYSKTIKVRVSEEWLQSVTGLRQKKGLSLSEYIRVSCLGDSVVQDEVETSSSKLSKSRLEEMVAKSKKKRS